MKRGMRHEATGNGMRRRITVTEFASIPLALWERVRVRENR